MLPCRGGEAAARCKISVARAKSIGAGVAWPAPRGGASWPRGELQSKNRRRACGASYGANLARLLWQYMGMAASGEREIAVDL